MAFSNYHYFIYCDFVFLTKNSSDYFKIHIRATFLLLSITIQHFNHNIHFPKSVNLAIYKNMHF